MADNPYQPPAALVADHQGEPFHIWLTFASGCAGYGAIFALWVFAMPVWQQFLLNQGVAMNELNTALYGSTWFNVYRVICNAVAGGIAGAFVVRITSGRPYLHAAVATAPLYCIYVARYFGVYPVPYPFWSELSSFLLPLPVALVSAHVMVERGRTSASR